MTNIVVLGRDLHAYAEAAMLAMTLPVTLLTDHTIDELSLATMAEPDLADALIQAYQKNQLKIKAIQDKAVLASADIVIVYRAVRVPDDINLLLSQAIIVYRGVISLAMLPIIRAQHITRMAIVPSFARGGAAMIGVRAPSVIAIGTDDNAVYTRVATLYQSVTNAPIVRMDLASAALAKLALNVHLAVRITMMNELAHIAAPIGADIEQVRHTLSFDGRIGAEYLRAGCGFGGTAFAAGLNQLANDCRYLNIDFPLIHQILSVNDDQKEILFRQCWRYFDADVRGRTIAVCGLAYKPHTADTTDAPALHVVTPLLGQGARVQAYDPVASLALTHDNYLQCRSILDAARDADALMICTEWDVFTMIDWQAIGAVMRGRVVFDGRNILDPSLVQHAGFTYIGIGRGMCV